MRRALAALAGALLLAGCPIPQAVPDYPPGSITPPRILVDQLNDNGTTVHFVPAGCPTTAEPSVRLSARVLDTNTIETIEARWFVNYDSRYDYYPTQPPDLVSADPDPMVLTREIPEFVFHPYQFQPAPGTGSSTGPPHDAPNLLRVVELVVSNGFDPAAEAPPYPLPYRTVRTGFETQIYRWVFMSVTPDPSCVPGVDPVCCPP